MAIGTKVVDVIVKRRMCIEGKRKTKGRKKRVGVDACIKGWPLWHINARQAADVSRKRQMRGLQDAFNLSLLANLGLVRHGQKGNL